jgi:antitoxin (DNA-binding transcriptional repressor) of toxin-antitoxin stability system
VFQKVSGSMTVIKDRNDIELSDLFASVSAGDEIIITQDGKPIARVEPITPELKPRVPGIDAGKFVVPPEFFDPLPEEILNAFYESQIEP